jgi:hypothetical protein
VLLLLWLCLFFKVSQAFFDSLNLCLQIFQIAFQLCYFFLAGEITAVEMALPVVSSFPAAAVCASVMVTAAALPVIVVTLAASVVGSVVTVVIPVMVPLAVVSFATRHNLSSFSFPDLIRCMFDRRPKNHPADSWFAGC